MPDLITHQSISYLANKPLEIIRNSTLFYCGAVLPDLATRAFSIPYHPAEFALGPLHTPLGIALLCLLLSFFFAEAERKQVFVSLIAGSSLHLFLDLFQKHMQPGYPLLFPFSWRTFKLGLLWPETIVSMVPLWLVIISVTAFLFRRKSAPGFGVRGS
jgi:hypothetical protein